MGVPLTFKHLDLIWKPILRVNKKKEVFMFFSINREIFFFKITLQSPETGTVDFAPRKFSIRETQGDRDVCMYTRK